MIIGLADKKIEIENRYPYVEEYCREYLTDKESDYDFSVHIMPEDIAFERQKSEQYSCAAPGNVYSGESFG